VIVPVLAIVILLTAIGTEARGVRFGRTDVAPAPQTSGPALTGRFQSGEPDAPAPLQP
jgi:hypothetical protein